MRTMRRVLPLSALLGQDGVRDALLLVAVDPRLGGVLLRGEKGTAKSTAARALASVLPPVEIDGEWREAPFETLPLGVSEDQLLGTLDLEHALREGRKRFEPGLLARAHGGVLYVDEVNLLEDHLVDLLLDVAACGVNVVAREGVHVEHPADFVLVGTMNPEEGDLRPQLLDRFGLCVEVEGVRDPSLRADIVERVLELERDPEGIRARFAAEEEALRGRVANGRRLLRAVRVDRELRLAAARLSIELGADGHRADLLVVKAAAAHAALEERTTVLPADFELAAGWVYPHRARRRPFEERPLDEETLRRAAQRALEAPEEVGEGKARRG